MPSNLFKIFLYLLSLFLISQPGFAEIKDVGFENRHTVRIDIRSDDDDYNLYLARTGVIIDYDFPRLDTTIKILPFFEYQHNFETNTWWRKELGTEIGTSFAKGYFYYGASLQHVWQQKENYPVELLEETTEWKSRFVITPPIQWGMFKDRLKLRLFDEYTYDFTRGQGTFNEVGVTLDWQVLEWLRLPLTFRHIDRIHDFDSDAIEISVLFNF